MSKDKKSKPEPVAEELDIGGKSPTPMAPPAPGAGPTVTMASDQADSDVATATSVLPGLGDADFIRSIVDTPIDQLIPWENVTLPSKGLYYDWDSGVVAVRAFGSNVDRIIATQRLAQTGQSLDYIFRECCKFPAGFDPSDLIIGDQIFLLYYLRGITHGQNYEFAVSCPNQDCGASSTHSFDLNTLAETITIADQSLGSEPFRVELPWMSKNYNRECWVKVRFMRSKDTSNVVKLKRAKSKAYGGGSGGVRIGKRGSRRPGPPQQQQGSEEIKIDDTLTQNLALVITEVNHVSDRRTIEQFVERMHSSDTAYVREWLDDHMPGVETALTVTCGECGNEYSMMLPITETFFRPENHPGS